MKRKWILFTFLILLTGCSAKSIEWSDFLVFQGEQFLVSHYAEISDPNFIGEPIGEIKKKLKDHVRSTTYTPKNGEAAYLDAGTKLYSVINHPYLIAVKDAEKINGFKVYMKQEYITDTRIIEHTEAKSFKKIEVYEEVGHNQFLFRKIIENSEELQEVMELLKTKETNDTVVYREDDPHSKAFAFVMYTTSPIAEKYAIYFNGKEYFNTNKQVLSTEIEGFLVGTEEVNSQKSKEI